jgi:hypothetical protein
VTLEEMAQVVREGSDVKVIDNTNKNDITYKTFIQLLHELERKSVGKGDVQLLNRVIRSNSGTLTGFINELEGVAVAEELPEVSEEVLVAPEVVTQVPSETMTTTLQ